MIETREQRGKGGMSLCVRILFFLPVRLLAGVAGCGQRDQRVVVYCADDHEFAEGILREFERRSGIKVETRYDTEANKSVGLYEDLVREAGRPRCDVHWNNEIAATIRLRKPGHLPAV